MLNSIYGLSRMFSKFASKLEAPKLFKLMVARLGIKNASILKKEIEHAYGFADTNYSLGKYKFKIGKHVFIKDYPKDEIYLLQHIGGKVAVDYFLLKDTDGKFIIRPYDLTKYITETPSIENTMSAYERWEREQEEKDE